MAHLKVENTGFDTTIHIGDRKDFSSDDSCTPLSQNAKHCFSAIAKQECKESAINLKKVQSDCNTNGSQTPDFRKVPP